MMRTSQNRTVNQTNLLFFTALLTALVFLSTTGCSSRRNSADGKPSLQKLRQTPTSLSIDGTRLRLECFLWRDFQPNSPPDGKPMRINIKIRSAKNNTVPAGIRLQRLYLTTPRKIWQTKINTVQRSVPDISATVSNGPFWKPGERVDVIVEFLTADSTRHFLRAAKQLIQRTD